MKEVIRQLVIGLIPAISCQAALAQQAPLASAPHLPPGKLVSVKVQNVPIREAFKQLSDQTGIDFTLSNTLLAPRPGAKPDDALVVLDVHDQPLWATVLALVTQADQPHPVAWSMSDHLTPHGYDRAAGVVSSSGPFLLVASRIAHIIDYQDTPDPKETLRLVGTLFTDPSMHLTSLTGTCNPSRAQDDKGNSLIPSSAPPGQPNKISGSTLFGIGYVNICLQYSPAGAARGHTLTILEGLIPASQIETQTLEVPINQTLEKQFDGTAVTIEYTTQTSTEVVPPIQNGGLGNTSRPVVTAIIRYRQVAGAAEQSNGPLALADRAEIRLIDTAGTAWQIASRTSTGDSNSRVVVCRFTQPMGPGRPVGDAVRAIFQIPTGSREIQVPYHFENLPLP